MAAADAFAAKGASDIDAQQMQAKLRALVADAVKNSTSQPSASPPVQTQQAVLRYALARHGRTAAPPAFRNIHMSTQHDGVVNQHNQSSTCAAEPVGYHLAVICSMDIWSILHVEMLYCTWHMY